MNRVLSEEFGWDDAWRRTHTELKYTKKDRANAERFFEGKSALLVKLGKITADQEQILVSCDQFRGEMYHAEHIGYGIHEGLWKRLEICSPHALHGTLNPDKWPGERLWLVAMYGEIQPQDEKVGAPKREILCRALAIRTRIELVTFVPTTDAQPSNLPPASIKSITYIFLNKAKKDRTQGEHETQ